MLIAAVAFTLRVALMLLTRRYHFAHIEQTNYAFGFETGSIAGSLASGMGFSSPFGVPTGPTAWIAPLYPAMLAAIFKLFGLYSTASAVAILTMNSAFAALTCVTIHALGCELDCRPAARLAAWCWAVIPFFMRWPTTWAWDPPVSAFLLSLLILIAVRLRSLEWRPWACCGVAWGATALVNPALLSLMPLALLYSGWQWRRKALPRAAFAFAVMLMLISPWLVRNRLAMGHWVFLRDNFGFEFSLGNFQGSPGVAWSGAHPANNPRVMEEYRRLGEVEFCRQKFEAAERWVSANPRDFAALSLKRAMDFWDGDELQHESPATETWKPWMVLLTSALAWAGMLVLFMRRVPGRRLLLGVLCVYPLPYYFTYTNPRYRHAIEPEMLLATAYLFWVLWSELRRRRAT